MGLHSSSAPLMLFSVQPALLQLMALLCSKCSSSRVQGRGAGCPLSLRLGIPALMATGPSRDVGVSVCLCCSLTQSLPVAAACRRQWDAAPSDGLHWLQQPELVDAVRRWGIPAGMAGGAFGRALGQSWGQPAPACPVHPVSVQTPWNTPGKWPLLVPQPAAALHPSCGTGTGSWGHSLPCCRSQGVKFAMPAPPSAGDDFSSPMLSCFSESASAFVLFT